MIVSSGPDGEKGRERVRRVDNRRSYIDINMAGTLSCGANFLVPLLLAEGEG